MFLSIVTVTKDDPIGLRRTIESIDQQSFEDYEHIVVNGTKGLDCAREVAIYSRLNRKFIFERDHGIYDAMNLGLNFASGDYLLFLNGGDELVADSLPLAKAEVIESSYPDLLCFKQEFVGLDGHVIKVRNHYGPNHPNFLIPFWHQAVLIKGHLHKKYQYDDRMKISGDHDLFLRLLQRSPSVAYSDLLLSRMVEGGVHQTNRDLALIESLECLLRSKFLTSRSDINRCHYFNSLISQKNMVFGYSALGKKIYHFLDNLGLRDKSMGLIWGNSLIGRQIYAVSPKSFRGFIDMDAAKGGIPGVPIFGLKTVESSFDFIILCANLDKVTSRKMLQENYLFDKTIYTLEDIDEFQ